MCCYPFQILTFSGIPIDISDVSGQGVNPFPFFGINAGRLRTCLNASGPVVGIETSCYVLIGDADKCIT